METVAEGVAVVRKGVLAHGVTSFCPTLVSSHPHVYAKVEPFFMNSFPHSLCMQAFILLQVLRHLKRSGGGKEGAEVLGAHVEGPFINPEKKGAHDPDTMKTFQKVRIHESSSS